ncbi:hypothetical protein D3C72_1624750 [compost metagenome]
MLVEFIPAADAHQPVGIYVLAYVGVQRFVGAGVVAGGLLLAVVGAVELERQFFGSVPIQGGVDRVLGNDAKRLAGLLVL